MSRYDDLFDETANRESVFAAKGELDPLRIPTEIVPRTEQERALAEILTGVTDGRSYSTLKRPSRHHLSGDRFWPSLLRSERRPGS
ncbi:hypothetical protein [Natronorarus salvus]|uniref:hypothetical protein n=1 Tax=Natronorarus salvus TaxID=3117733 RepID=UPI002F25FC37